MAISSSKKELEKKKAKEKEEKARKMKERRAENKKGKSLEDMMAYVDEDGNLSATPPDPLKKKEIQAEDIVLGVPRTEDIPESSEKTGVVSFFNEAKGFGFITETGTGEQIFVHINDLRHPVKERDRVVFETERTQKGLRALSVRKA